MATFGGGAYFIVQGKDNIATMIANSEQKTSTVGFAYVMTKLAGPIVGMMALSATLSILTVVLTKTFPKAVMYFLMGFTLLV